MAVQKRRSANGYELRVLTVGQRYVQCVCGTVAKFNAHPQRARIRCTACHRAYVLGTVAFETTNARSWREPSDLALPGQPAPADMQIGEVDRAPIAERTMPGGRWRSGEPVTILLPAQLSQLWRIRDSAELYAAEPIARGTRYALAPIELADCPERWQLRSAVEWQAEAERLS